MAEKIKIKSIFIPWKVPWSYRRAVTQGDNYHHDATTRGFGRGMSGDKGIKTAPNHSY